MIVDDVGSTEAARRPIMIVGKQAAFVFAFGCASTWVDEAIILLGLDHEDSPLGQNGRTAGLACESVHQVA